MAGRVTSWLDSSPVVSAEVTFAGAGSFFTALTDEGGDFELTVPRPGELVLASVLAEGYLPYAPEWGRGRLRYTARAGQRVEGAGIQLVPRRELDGMVLTGADVPVAGAEVRWLGVGTGETALADDDERATSDDRGTFRIGARLDAWLEAWHPELGAGRVRADARALATGHIVVRLDPTAAVALAEIAGRVLDPQGEGVAGARVLARPHRDGPDAEATTDEDGGFVLRDLVTGSYRVEARSGEHAPVWAGRVSTGSDRVVLQLADGGGIEGTLVTHDGEPIPASTALALRHTGSLTRVLQAEVTVFDAEGGFRLTGLPPGVYDVVGAASGHAPARVNGIEVGSAVVEIELVMRVGGRISGRVTDAATGAPVSRARVEIEGALAAGPSVAPLRTSTVSDDDGVFVLRGVEPGRRSIHAHAIGFAPRTISGLEVTSEGELADVELALSPAEDARGEAFDIVGIGVEVRVEGEALEILGVLEGGGASRAGLAEGDRVLAIDGIETGELLTFGEAVQALRGREGTEVTLLVARGEGAPFEVVATRHRIRG